MLGVGTNMPYCGGEEHAVFGGGDEHTVLCGGPEILVLLYVCMACLHGTFA